MTNKEVYELLTDYGNKNGIAYYVVGELKKTLKHLNLEDYARGVMEAIAYDLPLEHLRSKAQIDTFYERYADDINEALCARVEKYFEVDDNYYYFPLSFEERRDFARDICLEVCDDIAYMMRTRDIAA